MSVAGIYGTRGAIIVGTNLLVNNCGQFLFAGLNGGNYNFRYCTFDNSNAAITRSTASITVANNPYQDPVTMNFIIIN